MQQSHLSYFQFNFLIEGANLFNTIATGIDKKETNIRALQNLIQLFMSFSKPSSKFKIIYAGIIKRDETKNIFPHSIRTFLKFQSIFLVNFVDVVSKTYMLMNINTKSFIYVPIYLIIFLVTFI